MALQCEAFAENAWKKDMCSNCYRTAKEHAADGIEPSASLQNDITLSCDTKSLSGESSGGWSRVSSLHNQDEMRDTVDCSGVNSLESTSSATSLSSTGSYPAINSKLAETLDSLNISTKTGDRSFDSSQERNKDSSSLEMTTMNGIMQVNHTSPGTSMVESIAAGTNSHDVIQRLDSLVNGTQYTSSEQINIKSSGSTGKTGILKDTNRPKPDKKRSITFPEYEELQEIIGYGGECYYSSSGDEEDDSPPQKSAGSSRGSSESAASDELTAEERSIISLTKKNTTFNSHAQNLRDNPAGLETALKLGQQDKKQTPPIVHVTPFVREQTPGKVMNLVQQSQIGNSDFVKVNKSEFPATPSTNNSAEAELSTGTTTLQPSQRKKHDENEIRIKLCGGGKDEAAGGGRGEINKAASFRLGSDGSTENSDSDSNIRDSPSPPFRHGENRHITELQASSALDRLARLDSEVQVQVQSLQTRMERSETVELNGQIISSQEETFTKYNLSSNIKELPTNHVTIMSTNIEDESNPFITGGSVATSNTVNIEDWVKSDVEMSSLSDSESLTVQQNDNVTKVDDTDNDNVEDTSVTDQKVEDIQPKRMSLVGKSESVKQSSSPRVKLTRKSPYVIGPPTAILKGTPKPVITRKPALPKDKPKVPVKPNKLILRSASSSPATRAQPAVAGGNGDTSLSSLDLSPDFSSLESTADEILDSNGGKYYRFNDNKSGSSPNLTVLSQGLSERKAAATKPTPISPENGPSATTKKRATSLVRKSPVARPRTSSFRRHSEYINLSVAPGSENILSVDSNANSENSSNEEPKRKELRPNNSLIITVFGSNNNNATPLRNKNQEAANDTPNNDKESDSNATSNETSAETPKVQRSLAVKNREALEAIRQSLSNKLISQAPPARVIESMKASGSPVIDMIADNSSNNATPTKPKIEKKTSSSFEDARAALEGALHFSRHAMPSNSPPVSTGSNITVSTPSSAKRQAPKPPSNTTQETSEIIIDNDSKKVAAAKIDDSVDSSVGERQRLSAPEIEVSGANTNDERVVVDESKNIEGKEEIEQTTNYADEHLQNSPSISIQQNSPSTPIETPKLTPAIRHSSMKSDLKPRDNKAPRSVQFSPDTMTVTVPANEPRPPKMISYNRWIAKNPYLESSFTGQPISMLPPGAVPPAVAKQQKMVPYPTAPVVDDTPRKWTEKKKKWRSKSTPRVSEIDELMGSSKTKAPSKLAIFTSPSSPEPPIRRQSRVEIYESEKQKVSTKKGKFSLKNLFFPPGANGVGNNGPNGDGNAPNNSGQGGGVNGQGQYNNENKFLDKEHEREILERHKVKTRPEIIHPLDLINGGVEVVKITPKNSLKGHYDRQKLSLPGSTTSQRRATIMSRSSEHINSLRSSAAYEMTAVSDYLNGHGTPLHMRSTPEIVTKIDVEGKDSGHDTSSIHTESSEDTATGSADYSNGSSSTEHTLSPIGMVAQPNVEALNNQISILGLNSSGKPKPPPPPRSKSLEVLEKSDSGDLEYPASGHPFQVTLDTGSLDNLLDSSCDTTPRIHTIHHSEEGLVTPRYTTSDTYSDNTSVRTTNTTRSNGLREVPLAPPPPPSVTQSLNNHFMLTGKNPSNVEDAAASPFSNVSHSSSIAQFINKTLATNAAFANATSTAVSIPTSVAAIDAANNAALIAAAAAAAANSAAAAANFHHQKSNSTSGSLSSEPMSECSSSLVRYPVNGASNGGNGSEADSERDSVSPQRGVCEEKLQDNDSPVVASNRRRLSVRRGRSIVHKNLEDNYGAVISANHEALAQILEQVSENRPVPASLRPLTTATAATSPQFADFSVLSESEGVRTPRRAFFPATWGPAHLPVTLMVSRDMSLTGSQATSAFSLNPVTQFVDQIPNYLLSTSSQGSGLGITQGVVWALPRTNIISLPTAAKQLHQRKKGMRQEEFEKELNFVLLQVMNGLKYLQAQGVEMVNTSLDRILLARTDTDHNYRLIITDEVYQPIGSSSADTALTNSQQQLSLCECGLAAMLLMFQLTTATPQMLRDKAPLNLAPVLPSVSMYKTMATILQKDGSVALGQVKCMLEYMLWGPSDIIFEVRADHEVESREEWLQRWLDLERANVLNNIIRSQGLWNIQLNVFQEYHLLFLVRTCAKMLRESSLLFESEVSRM